MESLYIDSNVWNLLYDWEINLRKEFPKDKYELMIVGEQQLENKAIVHNDGLASYVEKYMVIWDVKVDRYFGFFDERHNEDDQRVGGFSNGRYIQDDESDFIEKYSGSLKNKKKRSGLYRNEADLSLAARSVHSIVLTFDTKKGPLKWAKDQGHKIIDLNGFDRSSSLSSFVQGKLGG